MGIVLNDNIKINAGKPVESKYLNLSNIVYSSIAEVNSSIPISERHVGLTVNINYLEYWYKDGVQDSDLVLKTIDSGFTIGSFISGATNIGFFSGTTAIQTLPIDHLTDNNYDGDYVSLFNYYYRDINGIIRIGVPSDGILKRGYVKTSGLVKSWIWNEFVGSGNQVGWILIDGNIDDQIGTFQNGVTYYGTSSAYTNTLWVQNNPYNNASNLVVNAVIGNLTSGTTLTIGGPVYANTQDRTLEFRTIKTRTPNLLAVDHDSTFVYLSGASAVLNGQNIGSTGFNTAGVFAQRTGTTLQFRRIVGSGDTTVTQVGNNIVLFSTGGTGSISVNNLGSGVGVYDSTSGNTMLFRSILGSGGTSVNLSGGTILISSIDGTYNLSSPAAITVGGINAGTELTGKTAFQLFEELLVPTLFPTLTAPSNTFNKTSPSGTLFKVGFTTNIIFDAGFNRGSITPPYGTSGFRSGLPSSYNYTGSGLPSSVTTSSLSNTQTVSGYTFLIGNQSWTNTVSYLVGEQPKDSKGNDFNSPLSSGTTSPAIIRTYEGVYPLFGTTSNIITLTEQTLVSMLNGNNIVFNLVAETGGNKQKFDIPNPWTGTPTNRPLVGVQTFNTVSNQWEYQGGSAGASLTFWSTSSTTHTIESNIINYTRYTYNSTDRSAIQIRLVF